MPNNRGMVTLARKLGFDVDIQLDEGIVACPSLNQRINE
jgi:acetyltransferase